MAVRSICICIPTYNEAENLEGMVAAVLAVTGRLGLDGSVLVIDDGSPDGTGVIADRLADADPRVAVLHRDEKAGIGPAYMAGFRWAVARGADLVVQMDCDFSHDPADIAHLVAAAGHADVAVGSRYVAGGEVRDWPLGRRLVSRAGCRYARTVLRVGVRDLTSGFKCFRAPALASLLHAETRASGYGFQIEMTLRALRAGLRVHEVPIVFSDRTLGSSKMSRAIAVEAAWVVLALRRERSRPPVPRIDADTRAAAVREA